MFWAAGQAFRFSPGSKKRCSATADDELPPVAVIHLLHMRFRYRALPLQSLPLIQIYNQEDLERGI